MTYDFDKVAERRGTPNLKWNAYPAEVLPLFVADMDFVSPAPVVEALRRQVDSGLFGYPDGSPGPGREAPGLRAVVVERMQTRCGWRVQPEDIVLLPGVVTGFHLAIYAFSRSDGAVLIQPPVYPPIHTAAKVTGRRKLESPLVQDQAGGYAVDWDQFRAAAEQRPDVFLLCNPQNPTGRVFRRAELERMAELCLANRVLICADEIHSDLVFDAPHVPIASLSPEIAARTVTLLAPSKTYNIAGLQCSLAIIQDPALRRQFLAARQGLVPWVNLMGLVAGEAAYRHGQEWLDQVLAYLRANRDFLMHTLREQMPAVKCREPEGTYLAWIDCRAALPSNPYTFFLQKAKVALSDGADFGTGGAGFVRLNFGCPRSLLADGLARMKAALDSAAPGGA